MTNSPSLLLATFNAGKLRELLPILDGLGLDLLTLAEVSPVVSPAETGRTFAENARIKALAYASATGLLTVAEDSGLEIDALDGAPGVESARLGGGNAACSAAVSGTISQRKKCAAARLPNRRVTRRAILAWVVLGWPRATVAAIASKPSRKRTKSRSRVCLQMAASALL